MTKDLLEKYLNENKLVKQHLDSYNRFIEEGIQRIVSSVGVIRPNVPNYELKLGKAWVEKPMVIESDSATRPILPMEARQRDLTYAGRVYMEITPIINDIERKTTVAYIGDIPAMIRSKICYTEGMSRGELIKAGEDPMDPGGYMIINGTERVLIGIEDLIANRIMVTKEKQGTVITAKIFSQSGGARMRCAVNRSEDGTWTVEFPAAPPKLPFMVVLRALGIKKDEDILELFDENQLIINDVLLNIETGEVKTVEDAIDEIGKKAVPGQPKEYRDKRVEALLNSYLLPHFGTTPAAKHLKAKFLALMAQRTTLVANKKYPADDKDHYGNKRIKLSGVLMEELFRYSFQFLVRDISYQAERAVARGRRLQDVQTFVRPDSLSDRIRYAMATGNWIAGQTGVCQLLDRISYLATVSHLRRLNSPLSRVHPHFEARDLHGTQFGRLCPNETPEGASASLVKNMALTNEISIGLDEKEIEALLKKSGVTSVK
ncbi:MAG: DNA-directed RNA polymerase subunit B'' [Candidatus Micrarchaeia archaeon]